MKLYAFLIVILLFISMSCFNDSGTSPNTSMYNIHGRIIDDEGNGIPGITIILTGNKNLMTKTSDINGIFSFAGLSDGIYIIEPKAEKYEFNPLQIEVEITDSNKVIDDIVGSLIPYIENNSNEYTNMYFPLKYGATWEYTLNTVLVKENNKEITEKLLFKVADTTIYHGEYFYVVSRNGYNIFYRIFNNIVYKFDSIYLDFNKPVGEGWFHALNNEDSGIFVSTEETINVSAGEFQNCLEIEYNMNGGTTIQTLWLAPHVGIVKFYEINIIDGVLHSTGTMELESYSIP